MAASSSAPAQRSGIKFKCVEYGSSHSSEPEPNRIRQRGPSSSNDFFYYTMSQEPLMEEVSGEAIDSGLSSDTEGFTPPPLPRRAIKKSSNNHHDLDDSQSDVSADSLALTDDGQYSTDLTSLASSSNESSSISPTAARKQSLPTNLLMEIRTKAANKLQPSSKQQLQQQQLPSIKELGKAFDAQMKVRKSSSVPAPRSRNVILTIPTVITQPSSSTSYSSFDLLQDPASQHQQRFHMCEYLDVAQHSGTGGGDKINHPDSPVDDLSFVGLKDILNVEKCGQTIRSHKSGTVRGVRNRVRAGITTFLQGKTLKSYAEREQGKVVVYTTSMGVVRQTYQRCLHVQRILGTLLISYEERDVSMNRQVQQELKERMNRSRVIIPQVFVEGQLLGDADTIEKLNETGDLRQILRRYKRVGPETVCDTCGGYRYLPCTICSGSKKSIHRNHFTAEFVALKCITCNEAGLIRCVTCSSSSSPA